MELDGGKFGMCHMMERIDILRHHRTDIALFPEIPDCPMRRVWLRFLKSRPPNKTPGPVSLAGLVTGHKLVKVYRPISFIRDICAMFPSIIGQSGRY